MARKSGRRNRSSSRAKGEGRVEVTGKWTVISFRCERERLVARLHLTVHTWDGRLLRCAIEVSPRSTLTEIVDAAQRRIDKGLEEVNQYVLYSNNREAVTPWTQRDYELRLKTSLADSVVVRSRHGDVTVPVPKLRPQH
jgi:hypothetical protein